MSDIASVIVALATLVTAVGGVIVGLRASQKATHAASAAATAAVVATDAREHTTEKLAEIHTLVNDRLERALAEIEHLKQALREGRPT